MRSYWYIRNVPDKTRLKLGLIATSQRITLAKLLEQLANAAWDADDSDVHPKSMRKIKRCISRYQGAAKDLLD